MSPRGLMVSGMCLRAALAFIVGIVLYFTVPSGWLKIVAAPAEWLAGNTSFYLDDVEISVDQMSLQVKGNITLGAVLIDGSIMPPLPAEWNKQGGQTMTILVLAIAAFAAPAASLRRRIMLIPVMLLAVVAVSAIDLALEIQYTSVKNLLGTALSSFSFMADEINEQINARLVSRYYCLELIKVFIDGGGRLFLGAVAGVLPHLLKK